MGVQILTWYRGTGSGRSWSDRERYSVFRGMVSRGVVSVGAGGFNSGGMGTA
jgi:hypothetical protein